MKPTNETIKPDEPTSCTSSVGARTTKFGSELDVKTKNDTGDRHWDYNNINLIDNIPNDETLQLTNKIPPDPPDKNNNDNFDK